MVKVVTWPSTAAVGEKPEKVGAGGTGVADTAMFKVPNK